MGIEEMYSEEDWRNLNEEFSKVIAQRDMLKEALEGIANDPCNQWAHKDARAALVKLEGEDGG